MSAVTGEKGEKEAERKRWRSEKRENVRETDRKKTRKRKRGGERSQREDGVIQKREIDGERQMAPGERCFKGRRDRSQEGGWSEILRNK